MSSDTVTLNECPPGLFWFGDTLGFKSEYTTTLENPRRYQCDAYVVESGEYFHGGAKNTEERGKLMVQPVEAFARHRAPDAEPVAWMYEGAAGFNAFTGEYSNWRGPEISFRKPLEHDGIRNLQALYTHPAELVADRPVTSNPCVDHETGNTSDKPVAQAVEALREVRNALALLDNVTATDSTADDLGCAELALQRALAAMGERQ